MCRKTIDPLLSFQLTNPILHLPPMHAIKALPYGNTRDVRKATRLRQITVPLKLVNK